MNHKTGRSGEFFSSLLDRSTLADWVGKSIALLEPLADAIGRHVLSAEAIFADDTPISMLAPGSGKTQTAMLWTYARYERHWGGWASPAAYAQHGATRHTSAVRLEHVLCQVEPDRDNR